MKIKYIVMLCLLLSNKEIFSKNSQFAKPTRQQSKELQNHTRRKSNKGCCIKDALKVNELTVCGNSCLQNVTVNGNETVNGTLNVNGPLLVNGSTITPCANGCLTTPASSTDNAIVLFSGTTGKILKQSPAPVTIDSSNNIAQANNITMGGNLNMVATPSDLSVGVITKNNQRFIYDLGDSTCTFVGVNAGLATPTSFSNTGVGFQALGSLASGSFNTAIGRESMHFGASGSFNTAIGSLSLIQSTGSFNTALGYNTLQGLAGSGNVAVGAVALQNTTGTNNVAVGFQAGSALTTGVNNIYIGTNVGPTILTPSESNTIRIGITGIHTGCFIGGIADQVPGPGAIPVLIGTDGKLGIAVSSARYKEDIKDIGETSSNLMKLRPVTFKYKPEVNPSREIQFGLIAEEVAEVYPDLVVYNQDNQPESVKYHLLNALLLNELNKVTEKQKEQEQTINELLARIAKLEGSTTN